MPERDLVVLTSHPLQRVGAYALARLAKKRAPAEIDEDALRWVVESVMRRDLLRTAVLDDAKAPGGFWLGVSYLLWPNSPINPTSRKKQSVAERREKITEWRRLPDAGDVIEAPCVLCGRPGRGFYGKVDVPLGASVAHRNTTVRGHDGLALCRTCLASFHALPYACAISGGRAAALHSWDDEFLRRTTSVQVRRTRRDADIASGTSGADRPYARQVAAVQRIRGYDERLTSGVDLIVFSNSNKEQVYDRHAMEQPLAEWLRRVSTAGGWRYLVRAHSRPKMPGSSALAKNLFDSPTYAPRVAVDYFIRLIEDLGVPPAETPELGELCSSYLEKVLDVKEHNAAEIGKLAAGIAEAIDGPDNGELKRFVVANRKIGELRKWLRRKAIDRTLTTKIRDPFITDRQWQLLFDSADEGYLHRDLLLIRTLMEVHARDPKWREDDPETRNDLDDELNAQQDEEE